MVIKPIKRLYGDGGNKLTAMKERKKLISENVKDENFIRSKFEDLFARLREGRLNDTLEILVNELFFEEIVSSFIMRLYIAFDKATDREEFVNNLRESYMIRGVVGIQASWTPLMSR